MRRAALLLTLAASIAASPAGAKVTQLAPGGFVTEHEGESKAPPAAVWALLVRPSRWWNKAHSYSGDAARLSIEARPGGCFCESLPGGGGVVHATVVQIRPRSLLRLSGALGPLQEQAVTGTLSITLTPTASGGTRLRFAYVVGGHAGFSLAAIASAVDGMIGEQHGRLLALSQS